MKIRLHSCQLARNFIIQIKGLTLAFVVHSFISWAALALTHGHHPFSIHSAVNAWLALTLSIFHTSPSHLPQCLVLAPCLCHCLRECCQTLHCGGACFVVNPYRVESYTSPDVLESQIKALVGEILHHLCLCVDPHISDARDFIRCNGCHFAELALTEAGADVSIGFGSVQVESFFAGKRLCVERIAVTHKKANLHKHPCGSGVALDEGGTQPVVLLSFFHIANKVVIEQGAINSLLAYLPLQ